LSIALGPGAMTPRGRTAILLGLSFGTAAFGGVWDHNRALESCSLMPGPKSIAARSEISVRD